MYSGCWGRARSDLRGVRVCISSSLFCSISGIIQHSYLGRVPP
jgi:hypothetical protein